MFDVIVVGARVAGASTALLLARAGLRVLVVDRDRRGTDTLSTHALMRPAVLLLERWGVLDALIEAGTPPQHRVVFHYGDRQVPVETARALYAPRRTLLDATLVAAAEDAGVEFRFGVDVRGLLRGPSGRVTGVRVRPRGRAVSRDLRARYVVGADGRRSRVAAAVGAPILRASTVSSAFAYGYWSGVDAAGYEWCYRPGSGAGLIPTNDGLVCVFVGVPPARFHSGLCAEAGFLDVLARTSRDVAGRVAAGRLVGPIRGFSGMAGWLRHPWGPGWALVGDAGYFKDPTTAHGISDALRDAHLLAGALHGHLAMGRPAAQVLRGFQDARDRLSLPFFAVTDRVATFEWSLDEVQTLHRRMSALMQEEVEFLEAEASTAPGDRVA